MVTESDDIIPPVKFQTKDLIEKAKTSENYLKEIRAWLNTKDYPKLSDEQISIFLISCKNAIEDVKNRIDAFYKIKKGPLFEHLDVDYPNNKAAAETLFFVKMPKRTKEGTAIILHKLRDFDHSKYIMEHSMRMFFMLTELPLIENPPNGYIILFDMNGMSFMHLTKAKVNHIRTFVSYLDVGFPCYLRAVHVFNTLSMIDKVMMILKPFLPQYIYSRMIFHPPGMDMADFYKNHVPQECLPSDYGGELASLEVLQEQTLEEMKENSAYFEKEEAQRKAYFERKK